MDISDEGLRWSEPAPGPWRKSSYCGGSFSCVEVRGRGRDIEVRDSTNPDGPVLRMSRDEWVRFLRGARAGRFGA